MMPLIGILIIPTRGNCISAFLYQMLLFLKVFYLMHGGAKVLLLCIIDRENNGSTLCLNVRFDDRAAQVSAVLCIGHRASLSMHRRINWNVLMMIAGTMLLVHYFIDSKMPNLLADFLLKSSKNVMWVTVCMSLFATVAHKKYLCQVRSAS